MLRFYKTARGRAGNALFIILIAIGLFAALNYAVSRTSRGGTANITDGQARVIATEILSFHGEVKNAVNFLLLNGCSESELNLAPQNNEWFHINGLTSSWPANPRAAANDRCSLFHPKGAGLTPRVFTRGMLPVDALHEISTFPGHSKFMVLPIPFQGTELNDLVMITDHVTEKVCETLNRLTGNPKTILATGLSTGVIYAGNFDDDIPSQILNHDYGRNVGVCYIQAQSSWIKPGHKRIIFMTTVYAR